jgi:pimeloyl-ACP methyl ester carboxylesterase
LRRLLIPGTGCSHTAAFFVYNRILWTTGSTIFPLHKLGLVDPEESIERLTKTLQDNGPAVLIGHSQGGLVGAAVRTRHPLLVERLITLGAPLKGTLLAPPLPGAIGAMSPSSPLCKEIKGAKNMHCIVGTNDLLVQPIDAGLLPDAHQYRFPTGHMGLIRDRRVVSLVVKLAFAADPFSYSGVRNDNSNEDIGQRSA